MPQRIVILIACHRAYPVPEDPCFLLVEVGAALHVERIPAFMSDDTGENISRKNKNHCELTTSIFGFAAERLLDVWIETNGYSYRELPYVFMERQNELKKGIAFVMRKFGRRVG